VLNRWAIRM